MAEAYITHGTNSSYIGYMCGIVNTYVHSSNNVKSITSTNIYSLSFSFSYSSYIPSDISASAFYLGGTDITVYIGINYYSNGYVIYGSRFTPFRSGSLVTAGDSITVSDSSGSTVSFDSGTATIGAISCTFTVDGGNAAIIHGAAEVPIDISDGADFSSGDILYLYYSVSSGSNSVGNSQYIYLYA